jgi:hypothetical protein
MSAGLWVNLGSARLASERPPVPFPATLTPALPGAAGALWMRARLHADAFTASAVVRMSACAPAGCGEGLAFARARGPSVSGLLGAGGMGAGGLGAGGMAGVGAPQQRGPAPQQPGAPFDPFA